MSNAGEGETCTFLEPKKVHVPPVGLANPGVIAYNKTAGISGN